MVGLEGISGIYFDRSGCVVTLQDGRRFRFDLSRAAGWLYSVPFTGTFERKETEYVRKIVQPGWVCVDVGACFGWYSVLLSQAVGACGQVHAFEPVKPNFECLTANVALNDATNVRTNNVALGDRPGRLQLYLPFDGVSASFRPHAAISKCSILETDVTTLDAYAQQAGLTRLDFLKADIEGGELLFLKGGRQTLERFKPTLLLEIQAHSTHLFGYEPEAVFNFLEELGYRASYLAQDGTLVPVGRNQSNSLPDHNFVFSPLGTVA
jgi:FkbM family methyltransferase